ncbi:MAG: hypothetical protein KDA25_05850, partial [Phycisphaerales bacterium]|nr:hypothetical protein [Phycisphaerales bacterium]
EIDLAVASVTGRLVRPAAPDPFVDAYTRWQLTSLAPPRPALDGRAFEQFLRDLPRMVPNPWAAPETVRRFDAIRAAGPIPPARMAAVEAMIAAVAAREARARQLARPALEFRAWLIASSTDDPGSQLALMFEQLGAMIAAGWDVERVKATIGARCDAIGRDREIRLTPEARDRIERIADAIAGRRAVIVANPSVSDGVLSFDVRDAAVYDFEIRAWLRALGD